MKEGNLVLNDFSFQVPKKKGRFVKNHLEGSPGTQKKLQMIRKKEITPVEQASITVMVEEDNQSKRLN